MFAAGVILINILQMYNWTNKRFIQVVLIFYFLQQFLGYISPLPYNPWCQWALSPKYYYPIGFAMILLGVLDIWIFFFNPLQNNIFFDQEKSLNKAVAAKSNRSADSFAGVAAASEIMDTTLVMSE